MRTSNVLFKSELPKKWAEFMNKLRRWKTLGLLGSLVLFGACSHNEIKPTPSEPSIIPAESEVQTIEPIEPTELNVAEAEDKLKRKARVRAESNAETDLGASSEDMSTAIKQALSQGINDAIYLLGSLEGFNLSTRYRIPIPEELQKPAAMLRTLGQGDQIDEFELRLNRSAQRAVKQANDVFLDALDKLSVDNARAILEGEDTAATGYFRREAEGRLRRDFLPIVRSATDRTGLTHSYLEVSNRFNRVEPGSRNRVDIDQYVVDIALEALFDRISVEERRIREQPQRRSTALMKEVFDQFKKP